MTKLFMGLILMSLTLACGKGFDKKKKAKPESNRQEQGDEEYGAKRAAEYVELLNEYRIKLKLRPLSYNTIIEDVAKSHSKAMAVGTRPFGHIGYLNRCRQIKNRLGPYELCGEVVAMGQKSAKEVFIAWIKSPRHRRKLENPAVTHTGLGIQKDSKGRIYWTQMMLGL